MAPCSAHLLVFTHSALHPAVVALVTQSDVVTDLDSWILHHTTCCGRWINSRLLHCHLWTSHKLSLEDLMILCLCLPKNCYSICSPLVSTVTGLCSQVPAVTGLYSDCSLQWPVSAVIMTCLCSDRSLQWLVSAVTGLCSGWSLQSTVFAVDWALQLTTLCSQLVSAVDWPLWSDDELHLLYGC